MTSRYLPAILAVFVTIVSTVDAQQPTPEQQAATILDAGQKAYAAGDVNGATAKFNEVLQKFATTKSISLARYGLAQIGMQVAEPDWAKILEHLTQASANTTLPDYGHICYALAFTQRTLALREAKPEDASKRLTEASKNLDLAIATFTTQNQEEWSIRSQCDKVDIELRLNRVKEARALADTLVKNTKTKYRPLALYYHGLACFTGQDYNAAGKSLSQLSPFADPVYGLHARYLLGRVLQLGKENAEAFVQYDAVIAEYEKSRLAAVELLKQPDRFKAHPFELARLRALVQGPLPEYMGGALFHCAGISYTAGRFSDAAAKYQAFIKFFPKDTLVDDAALRAGFALVQLKQFDEAVKLMTPLIERNPRLADQALFWSAKAHVGIAQQADPAKPADRETKWKYAIENMKLAVSQTAKMKDPEAQARLPEYQLELADTLQSVQQYQAAGLIYADLWNAKSLAGRNEELLQRYADAAGTSGNLPLSAALVAEFRKTYPDSTLMPAVALRDAENTFAKTKAAPTPELWKETIEKYKQVVEKYPEFDRANIARFGLGLCFIQLNDLESAVKAFEGIPGPDRNGDVALAAYLLSDCLIRLAPTRADDALQENQIREKLDAASANLETFVSGNPKAPEVPQALMKYALCQRRLGINLTDGNERNASMNRAREAYIRITKEFPNDPMIGQARIEIAKTKQMQGDRGGAINDYKAIIAADAAAKKDPYAVLSTMSLAVMYREQNQPAEADKLLAEVRPRYEAELAKDANRYDLQLKYHHGVALLEFNKPGQARELLEDVASNATDPTLKLEASLRSGQSRIIEARKLWQDAQQASNQAGQDVKKRIAAEQLLSVAYKGLKESADTLVQRADASKEAAPTSDVRARMYYDAAWAYREIAVEDIAQARDRVRRELQRALLFEAKKRSTPYSPEPAIQLYEIDRSQIPPMPSEAMAMTAFTRMVTEFPELALCVDARLDLAEMQADRGEHANVVKVLKSALDVEPTDKPATPDTLERVRLRLGASQYMLKDYKAAATQFDILAGNPKSQFYVTALFRAGESHYASGDFKKASERLAPFRDKGELQGIGNISDRAMLCRAKAFMQLKDPAAAKQNLEFMVQRFNQNSPYTPEARFIQGQILEGENKHDDAIKTYEAVMQHTRSEIAAMSALRIGECRMVQKKYPEAALAFQSVTYTYDYPELGIQGLLLAGKAYIEDKKTDDAERVLRKVIGETPPESEPYKLAQELLTKVKK